VSTPTSGAAALPPDRAADEVAGVERFAAHPPCAIGGRVREQGDAGDAEVARLAHPIAISETGQRETPGRLAIGSSSSPAAMNKGQIRSDGARLVSATIARLQAAERVRRMRT
jgi:osmotically-inducible protein OsmY